MQAEHQMLLARRLRLELDRKREEFEQRVDQQAQQQESIEESVATAGFEKEVEELSLVKPKVAVDRLLNRPIEDAAQLLSAMDARTSKKIIEAAYKNAAKWGQMNEILDRKRQLDASATEQEAPNG